MGSMRRSRAAAFCALAVAFTTLLAPSVASIAQADLPEFLTPHRSLKFGTGYGGVTYATAHPTDGDLALAWIDSLTHASVHGLALVNMTEARVLDMLDLAKHGYVRVPLAYAGGTAYSRAAWKPDGTASFWTVNNGTGTNAGVQTLEVRLYPLRVHAVLPDSVTEIVSSNWPGFGAATDGIIGLDVSSSTMVKFAFDTWAPLAVNTLAPAELPPRWPAVPLECGMSPRNRMPPHLSLWAYAGNGDFYTTFLLLHTENLTVAFKPIVVSGTCGPWACAANNSMLYIVAASTPGRPTSESMLLAQVNLTNGMLASNVVVPAYHTPGGNGAYTAQVLVSLWLDVHGGNLTLFTNEGVVNFSPQSPSSFSWCMRWDYGRSLYSAPVLSAAALVALRTTASGISAAVLRGADPHGAVDAYRHINRYQTRTSWAVCVRPLAATTAMDTGIAQCDRIRIDEAADIAYARCGWEPPAWPQPLWAPSSAMYMLSTRTLSALVPCCSVNASILDVAIDAMRGALYIVTPARNNGSNIFAWSLARHDPATNALSPAPRLLQRGLLDPGPGAQLAGILLDDVRGVLYVAAYAATDVAGRLYRVNVANVAACCSSAVTLLDSPLVNSPNGFTGSTEGQPPQRMYWLSQSASQSSKPALVELDLAAPLSGVRTIATELAPWSSAFRESSGVIMNVSGRPLAVLTIASQWYALRTVVVDVATGNVITWQSLASSTTIGTGLAAQPWNGTVILTSTTSAALFQVSSSLDRCEFRAAQNGTFNGIALHSGTGRMLASTDGHLTEYSTGSAPSSPAPSPSIAPSASPDASASPIASASLPFPSQVPHMTAVPTASPPLPQPTQHQQLLSYIRRLVVTTGMNGFVHVMVVPRARDIVLAWVDSMTVDNPSRYTNSTLGLARGIAKINITVPEVLDFVPFSRIATGLTQLEPLLDAANLPGTMKPDGSSSFWRVNNVTSMQQDILEISVEPLAFVRVLPRGVTSLCACSPNRGSGLLAVDDGLMCWSCTTTYMYKFDYNRFLPLTSPPVSLTTGVPCVWSAERRVSAWLHRATRQVTLVRTTDLAILAAAIPLHTQGVGSPGPYTCAADAHSIFVVATNQPRSDLMLTQINATNGRTISNATLDHDHESDYDVIALTPSLAMFNAPNSSLVVVTSQGAKRIAASAPFNTSACIRWDNSRAGFSRNWYPPDSIGAFAPSYSHGNQTWLYGVRNLDPQARIDMWELLPLANNTWAACAGADAEARQPVLPRVRALDSGNVGCDLMRMDSNGRVAYARCESTTQTIWPALPRLFAFSLQSMDRLVPVLEMSKPIHDFAVDSSRRRLYLITAAPQDDLNVFVYTLVDGGQDSGEWRDLALVHATYLGPPSWTAEYAYPYQPPRFGNVVLDEHNGLLYVSMLSQETVAIVYPMNVSDRMSYDAPVAILRMSSAVGFYGINRMFWMGMPNRYGLSISLVRQWASALLDGNNRTTVVLPATVSGYAGDAFLWHGSETHQPTAIAVVAFNVGSWVASGTHPWLLAVDVVNDAFMSMPLPVELRVTGEVVAVVGQPWNQSVLVLTQSDLFYLSSAGGSVHNMRIYGNITLASPDDPILAAAADAVLRRAYISRNVYIDEVVVGALLNGPGAAPTASAVATPTPTAPATAATITAMTSPSAVPAQVTPSPSSVSLINGPDAATTRIVVRQRKPFTSGMNGIRTAVPHPHDRRCAIIWLQSRTTDLRGVGVLHITRGVMLDFVRDAGLTGFAWHVEPIDGSTPAFTPVGDEFVWAMKNVSAADQPIGTTILRFRTSPLSLIDAVPPDVAELIGPNAHFSFDDSSLIGFGPPSSTPMGPYFFRFDRSRWQVTTSPPFEQFIKLDNNGPRGRHAGARHVADYRDGINDVMVWASTDTPVLAFLHRSNLKRARTEVTLPFQPSYLATVGDMLYGFAARALPGNFRYSARILRAPLNGSWVHSWDFSEFMFTTPPSAVAFSTPEENMLLVTHSAGQFQVNVTQGHPRRCAMWSADRPSTPAAAMMLSLNNGSDAYAVRLSDVYGSVDAYLALYDLPSSDTCVARPPTHTTTMDSGIQSCDLLRVDSMANIGYAFCRAPADAWLYSVTMYAFPTSDLSKLVPLATLKADSTEGSIYVSANPYVVAAAIDRTRRAIYFTTTVFCSGRRNLFAYSLVDEAWPPETWTSTLLRSSMLSAVPGHATGLGALLLDEPRGILYCSLYDVDYSDATGRIIRVNVSSGSNMSAVYGGRMVQPPMPYITAGFWDSTAEPTYAYWLGGQGPYRLAPNSVLRMGIPDVANISSVLKLGVDSADARSATGVELNGMTIIALPATGGPWLLAVNASNASVQTRVRLPSSTDTLKGLAALPSQQALVVMTALNALVVNVSSTGFAVTERLNMSVGTFTQDTRSELMYACVGPDLVELAAGPAPPLPSPTPTSTPSAAPSSTATSTASRSGSESVRPPSISATASVTSTASVSPSCSVSVSTLPSATSTAIASSSSTISPTSTPTLSALPSATSTTIASSPSTMPSTREPSGSSTGVPTSGNPSDTAVASSIASARASSSASTTLLPALTSSGTASRRTSASIQAGTLAASPTESLSCTASSTFFSSTGTATRRGAPPESSSATPSATRASKAQTGTIAPSAPGSGTATPAFSAEPSASLSHSSSQTVRQSAVADEMRDESGVEIPTRSGQVSAGATAGIAVALCGVTLAAASALIWVRRRRRRGPLESIPAVASAHEWEQSTSRRLRASRLAAPRIMDDALTHRNPLATIESGVQPDAVADSTTSPA